MGIEADTPTPLLKAVHDVNQAQRQTFFEKIKKHFDQQGGLSGKKIAVWGIAFKPGTDDVREAPAISLMQNLLEAGATVAAHDPVAHETCHQILGDQIDYREMYDTLEGAHALLICTDWPEFKQPRFATLKEKMADRVIFDGRNLYNPAMLADEGFTYISVGRNAVLAGESSASNSR